MLFTQTPVSTFSAYFSLKTIGAISTKFTYVVPPIYNTLQTKFERNTPIVRYLHIPEISRILFVFFFFTQNALAKKGKRKQSSSERIPTKFGTPLAPSLAQGKGIARGNPGLIISIFG